MSVNLLPKAVKFILQQTSEKLIRLYYPRAKDLVVAFSQQKPVLIEHQILACISWSIFKTALSAIICSMQAFFTRTQSLLVNLKLPLSIVCTFLSVFHKAITPWRHLHTPQVYIPVKHYRKVLSLQNSKIV